jgi:hypothetical protein
MGRGKRGSSVEAEEDLLIQYFVLNGEHTHLETKSRRRIFQAKQNK